MNIGKTGGTGEYLTAEFLRKNGCTVVKRNYHCRYGEIDKETFGDFSSSTEIMNKKATYVKSTKVKNGSETYTCEEYKASDGTIIKYYFNSKNEWKRWETIDGDTVGVFVINSFGKGAKSSLFEISKFWIKDDSFASLFK